LTEKDHGSFWGTLLRVDLTKGTCKVEDISDTLQTEYLGGRGLGVKIIYDEVDAKVDPFSKKNKLIFSTGPLTGTSIPTGCRYEVITKSPLTGTITGANAGGNFGTALKRTGLDVIVIQGKAKEPVYLEINNDDISILEASSLWGLSTHETTDTVIKKIGEIGKLSSVACIGPAGENKIRFASIINDKHRAAGRGGTGAVLGAKKLKAIAVSGSKRIAVIDKIKLQNSIKKMKDKIKTTRITHENLPKFGTAKILDLANDYHLLGTRNFQQSYFEDAKEINAEKLRKNLLVKKNTCYGCPIGCKRVTKVGTKTGEGPEFETIWAFGAQCGVKDLKAIVKANYLCNEMGLDTISTGNTIGCAMELSEKGFIKEKLKFGDGKLIQNLTKDIAHRNGFGNRLADGSYRLASSVDHPELSMSVKKLELPAYDPRIAQTQGLGYATSTRGACHVRAFVIRSDLVAGKQKIDQKTINKKTKVLTKTQNKMAVIDSIGMCMFSTYVCSIEDYRALLEAAAGIKFTSDDELLKAGEKIWTLEKVFNIKAGLTKEDDRLPDRFKTEKVKDSLDNEHYYPEEKLVTDYYKERGWTTDGIPTKKKLKELRL